jgi:hypothetical protein
MVARVLLLGEKYAQHNIMNAIVAIVASLTTTTFSCWRFLHVI